MIQRCGWGSNPPTDSQRFGIFTGFFSPWGPTGVLLKRLRQTSWAAPTPKHCDDRGISNTQKLYARYDSIVTGVCDAKIKPAKRGRGVRLHPRHGGEPEEEEDEEVGEGGGAAKGQTAEGSTEEEEEGDRGDEEVPRQRRQKKVPLDISGELQDPENAEEAEEEEGGTHTFLDELYRKVGSCAASDLLCCYSMCLFKGRMLGHPGTPSPLGLANLLSHHSPWFPQHCHNNAQSPHCGRDPPRVGHVLGTR